MVLPTYFMTAKPYAFFVRDSVHFQGKKIIQLIDKLPIRAKRKAL